ncbi:uncharacterized protein LOC129005503 isoform X2 [Macrosteles quadrilineatus]|uniref:uncharacterized protein LOC129005503 isoform X2 n=1 Tax=Macrosteles quadrilineatus TaxID=74068 RepID=UPI0023E19615|nr:uncharacterized protein LOC129005503 isoform X2 [Macrosteles quadrilineatus]
MEHIFEIKTLYIMLILCLSRLLVSVKSETVEEMSGPKKHKGIFRKQSTNKTIPYSEHPGKELIIFDVDDTLWPFKVDKDPRFNDPFTIKSGENNTAIVNGHKIEAYPEVQETLLELIEKGYVLAAVALSNSTDKVMALMNALDLTQHFKYMEMAEGPDKMSLITEIQENSGIKTKNIMFILCKYDREDIHFMLDEGVFTLPIGLKGVSYELMCDALYVFQTRKIYAEISDDKLPTTTESKVQRKLRRKKEKLERRALKKHDKSYT